MFCVHTHSHIHISTYVHVTDLLQHTGPYGEALESVRKACVYVCMCVYNFMCMFIYTYIYMYKYTKKEKC